NLLFPLLRLRKSRPLLAVTLHDLKVPYLFPKAGPVRGWANAAMRRGADLVFVTNGDDLAALGGHARVLPIGSNLDPVVLTPADRRAVRGRLGLADDDLALGYFGFVDPWKGVDTLLDAAEQLLGEGLSLRVVFVGGVRTGGMAAAPAYERAIEGRLAAEPLRPHVVRTGFAPPDETSVYLQALDVIALPFTAGACYRHGTLMAAIANGLPIVTTWPSANERALAAHGIAPLVDGEN